MPVFYPFTFYFLIFFSFSSFFPKNFPLFLLTGSPPPPPNVIGQCYLPVLTPEMRKIARGHDQAIFFCRCASSCYLAVFRRSSCSTCAPIIGTRAAPPLPAVGRTGLNRYLQYIPGTCLDKERKNKKTEGETEIIKRKCNGIFFSPYIRN
jgi:hypothetical protein